MIERWESNLILSILIYGNVVKCKQVFLSNVDLKLYLNNLIVLQVVVSGVVWQEEGGCPAYRFTLLPSSLLATQVRFCVPASAIIAIISGFYLLKYEKWIKLKAIFIIGRLVYSVLAVCWRSLLAKMMRASHMWFGYPCTNRGKQ